jgi:hypothetical protein
LHSRADFALELYDDVGGLAGCALGLYDDVAASQVEQ